MTAADHALPPPAVAAVAIAPRASGRPWTYYVLLAVFLLYVLALYGPMICIYILSFQDVRGGLVFPMKGFSLHWFVDLFTPVRTGDVKGAFDRSIKLAVTVTVITVVVSFLAGLRFAGASRRRHRLLSDDRKFGRSGLVEPRRWSPPAVHRRRRALVHFPIGAQLSWTPPFGVLVMFAVMSRSTALGRKQPRLPALRVGR
jgi:putative spermidine/putrescine transport system permease protein